VITEQDLEMILAEVRQTRKAIAEAVQQIVQQESEINELRLLLEQKGLLRAEELGAAGIQRGQQLKGSLARCSSEDSGGQPARRLTNQSKRRPYLCRPGM